MSATTIKVPPRLNRDSVTRFADEVAALPMTPTVFVGSHQEYCSGIDLEQHLDSAPADIEEVSEVFASCLAAISAHSAPTIAYVRGPAIGGGVGIAAACDFLLAGRHASFALPELLYGLIPGIVMPYLLERISRQRIRHMAFTGTALDAAGALAAGLVDRIVDDESDTVLKTLERELSRPDPRAVQEFRELLDRADSVPRSKWLSLCISSSIALQSDQENTERLGCFLSDGIPPWEARR